MNLQPKIPIVWGRGLKILVIGIILFFLWIFNQPYLSPLLFGFIVAVLTFPIFSWIRDLIALKIPKGQNPLAATLTILLLSGVLVLFLNIFMRQFIREIPGFVNAGLNFIRSLPDNQGLLQILANFGIDRTQLEELTTNLLKQVATVLPGERTPGQTTNITVSEQMVAQALTIGRQTFNFIFDFIVNLVVFLLAWFNGLTLGSGWLKNIFSILPLNDQERESIQQDLKFGIRNVVYANLLSGVIHAVVVFIIGLIFGVESIFVISLLVFLIGFLPLSPSELGYLLVLVPLFFINPIAAIVLVPVVELIILWVNFVLTPKIIASGEEGNSLLILTSILSGISIFGLAGFIIAPVIMVFVQTLYRILRRHLTTAEESKIANKYKS